MNTNSESYSTFLTNVENNILTPIISVIALAALILFVFGVVKFIRNSSDPKARLEGQQQMIWGIVGLVILFGANALVTLLKHIIGVT